MLALEGELFLVIHLMIAGRLQVARARRQAAGADRAGAVRVRAAGTLVLTEAGTQRRASLHLRARAAPRCAAMDPGGIDVLTADLAAFAARLRAENHTLKRALTDPHLFSGIGNAYSDEILHRARMSPLALTRSLDAGAVERLYDAARAVLAEWTERLRRRGRSRRRLAGEGHRVPSADGGARPLRPAVPGCGAPVQRIVHADNETNYCARCQTGGKLLADRALSRLLKESWPKNIDELG